MEFANIFDSIKKFAGSSLPSKETSLEVIDYENEHKAFSLRYKKAFLNNRKIYGFLTFSLVACWLTVMLFFILAQGIGRIPFKDVKFLLTDSVVIAMITTTTINVLALLIIVLRNLFPSVDKNAPAD
jgi:hypothetical protein